MMHRSLSRRRPLLLARDVSYIDRSTFKVNGGRARSYHLGLYRRLRALEESHQHRRKWWRENGKWWSHTGKSPDEPGGDFVEHGRGPRGEGRWSVVEWWSLEEYVEREKRQQRIQTVTKNSLVMAVADTWITNTRRRLLVTQAVQGELDSRRVTSVFAESAKMP